MTPEEFERERRKSAEALDRVREGAREEPAVRTSESVLGPGEPVKDVGRQAPRVPDTPAWSPPAPPDLRR